MNNQTKLTTGRKFEQKGKCKNNHSSPMSNSAWCDLNSKGDVLKLHDMCSSLKCRCQKTVSFSPREFQLEGSGFKSTMGKSFEGTEKMWKNFIKPGLKIASPIISAGVAANTKNPEACETTSNLSRSLTGLKIVSLPDMHGQGLRVKVM